jgi:hypothetical protein
MQAEVVFDSWAFFREDPVPAEVAVEKEGVRVRLEPLQSLLIRLRRG